jgi:hypothetical protein
MVITSGIFSGPHRVDDDDGCVAFDVTDFEEDGGCVRADDHREPVSEVPDPDRVAVGMENLVLT